MESDNFDIIFLYVNALYSLSYFGPDIHTIIFLLAVFLTSVGINKIFHIPTDLVVAQEASAVESSSRLDFLLLHNLGTSSVAP